MSKNIFIGNAWPYANNSLHIGHLAALLPGDVIARFHRVMGNDVIFVSGTDSHGTPITVRAKKEGVTPEEIAVKYHEEFKKVLSDLDFSYDLYTSTMTDYHKKTVQKYFKLIMENGYMEEREEDQDFRPSCNQFLSDREVVGECVHCGGTAKGDQCDNCHATLSSNELKNKRCGICGGSLIIKKNKHLYFLLSKFQQPITDLVLKREKEWRQNAVSETRKFLNMGLIDRAATRQLEWGVDVPVKGYEDKKIYVWIEAVMGYLTAGKAVAESRGLDFDKFLSEKSGVKTYYAHGKDNIPFHTVIFPSLQLSMKKGHELPDCIVSCEFLNMNDEKMSKSKGNLLTVLDMLQLYHKDTIRYFFIANGPEKKDSNFTLSEMNEAHNKYLVGVLGNFINRNLSFIMKKFEGKISEGKIDKGILELTEKTFKDVGGLIERADLRAAIDMVFDYASAGNKYYDDRKPWVQVKEDMDAFNDTTYTCVYMMANLSRLLYPFIPSTAERIGKQLNIEQSFDWAPIKIKGDIQLKETNLLFNRIEIK